MQELTKTQEDMIGRTYPTPNGGVLTVVTVNTEPYTSYYVECSICSKDIELTGGKLFKSYKHSLGSGHIPCWCRKGNNITESQWEILVKRELNTRGYIFGGWAEPFRGNRTKLRLYNPVSGNAWESTSIVGLMTKPRVEPIDIINHRGKGKLIDDSIHITEFINTGAYPEGATFKRSTKGNKDGHKLYWEYTCPVCSSDEYVVNSLCSGVFTVIASSLKRGFMPCRCSSSYKWTHEQREYQIIKACATTGATFIGLEGRYKNKYTKFKWLCSKQHECLTPVGQFLNVNSHCCRTCDKIRRVEEGLIYGYIPKRVEEPDNLYVITFNNEYVKVGRAFNIESRMKGGQGLLGQCGLDKSQLDVIMVAEGKHSLVYQTEQYIHKALIKRGFYHHESIWTNETFHMESIPTIHKLLMKSELEISLDKVFSNV